MKPLNQPALRFAGFADAWEQRKLGDIFDFYRGRGLSWVDISEDGVNACILYGNLYTDYGMTVNAHVKLHQEIRVWALKSAPP